MALVDLPEPQHREFGFRVSMHSSDGRLQGAFKIDEDAQELHLIALTRYRQFLDRGSPAVFGAGSTWCLPSNPKSALKTA